MRNKQAADSRAGNRSNLKTLLFQVTAFANESRETSVGKTSCAPPN